MNKAIVMVAIAVVAAVGISSFVLMSNNAGEISPVAEKSDVLEEKISVLDAANINPKIAKNLLKWWRTGPHENAIFGIFSFWSNVKMPIL